MSVHAKAAAREAHRFCLEVLRYGPGYTQSAFFHGLTEREVAARQVFEREQHPETGESGVSFNVTVS